MSAWDGGMVERWDAEMAGWSSGGAMGWWGGEMGMVKWLGGGLCRS